MKFKDKLIQLMKDQAEVESKTHEYINPYLLGQILGAMYEVGYMDDMPLQEQVKLDRFVDDMWGA